MKLTGAEIGQNSNSSNKTWLKRKGGGGVSLHERQKRLKSDFSAISYMVLVGNNYIVKTKVCREIGHGQTLADRTSLGAEFSTLEVAAAFLLNTCWAVQQYNLT
jgi:hypothetical protein